MIHQSMSKSYGGVGFTRRETGFEAKETTSDLETWSAGQGNKLALENFAFGRTLGRTSPGNIDNKCCNVGIRSES